MNFDGGTDEWLFKYITELNKFQIHDLEPGCDECGDKKTEEMDEILIKFTTEPVKYVLHETPLCRPNQRDCHAGKCTGRKQTSAIQIQYKEKNHYS